MRIGMTNPRIKRVVRRHGLHAPIQIVTNATKNSIPAPNAHDDMRVFAFAMMHSRLPTVPDAARKMPA